QLSVVSCQLSVVSFRLSVAGEEDRGNFRSEQHADAPGTADHDRMEKRRSTLANAGTCVKDSSGKPGARPQAGRGLAADSLTPPSPRLRRAMPGTPSPRLRRAQPYTDQRRGHAQTFLPLLLLLSLLLSSCLGYKEVVLHDVNDIEISKLDNDGMAV